MNKICLKQWLLFLSLLLCSFSQLTAQTFAEWFSQKKTQLKYLRQQIIALQVYTDYLDKGYSIAKRGLTAIGDFKDGEFNLHNNYFGSLIMVNPAVKHDAAVADIIALQFYILQRYRQIYRKVKVSTRFNPNEVDYVYRVFEHLLSQCGTNIDELITLTTNGRLELKDDERLRRIDALRQDMRDKASFTQSFCNDIDLLAAQRSKAQRETESLKKAYGLPQ